VSQRATVATTAALRPKTLAQFKKHLLVSEAWNEGEDGYWIVLKTGYFCRQSECHAIHEWTMEEVIEAFRTVSPCACRDCQSATVTKTVDHKPQ